jgi:hypothetical protein
LLELPLPLLLLLENHHLLLLGLRLRLSRACEETLKRAIRGASRSYDQARAGQRLRRGERLR